MDGVSTPSSAIIWCTAKRRAVCAGHVVLRGLPHLRLHLSWFLRTGRNVRHSTCGAFPWCRWRSNQILTKLGRGSNQTIGWSGSRTKPAWASSCAHRLQERGAKLNCIATECKERSSRISLKMTPPEAWSNFAVWMAERRFVESVSTITRDIPTSIAAFSAWHWWWLESFHASIIDGGGLAHLCHDKELGWATLVRHLGVYIIF